MTEREKLARLIGDNFLGGGFDGESEQDRAICRVASDCILAAGWRCLPTKGPEFEAAVDRGLAAQYLAICQPSGDLPAFSATARTNMRIALRAALNTGETDA